MATPLGVATQSWESGPKTVTIYVQDFLKERKLVYLGYVHGHHQWWEEKTVSFDVALFLSVFKQSRSVNISHLKPVVL